MPRTYGTGGTLTVTGSGAQITFPSALLIMGTKVTSPLRSSGILPLEPDCPGWIGVVKVPPNVLARPGFLYQISITRSAGGQFGAFCPQYTFHEAAGLPFTGAAGLTETGGGGHLIGGRLGETVLAGAGLLTDVELVASGELFATSEVFAGSELPQADGASATAAVASGVASNTSRLFVQDAFSMPRTSLPIKLSARLDRRGRSVKLMTGSPRSRLITATFTSPGRRP
jgi:hypothetical protein